MTNARIYSPHASVVFLKTKDPFGGFSNMSAGFPLQVNGVDIRTSEALYQACRFPHMEDLQRKIIDERSPMSAKMVTKPFLDDTRKDWASVRIKIMAWCLDVKLIQNWEKFGGLLLASKGKSIVELSYKDDFWGCKPTDNYLVGTNALGRLLMQQRELIREGELEEHQSIKPLKIPDFSLFKEPIRTISKNPQAGLL